MSLLQSVCSEVRSSGQFKAARNVTFKVMWLARVIFFFCTILLLTDYVCHNSGQCEPNYRLGQCGMSASSYLVNCMGDKGVALHLKLIKIILKP